MKSEIKQLEHVQDGQMMIALEGILLRYLNSPIYPTLFPRFNGILKDQVNDRNDSNCIGL